MSNFVEVIRACQNAGGAGSKKDIQAALAKADPIAQRMITEALNPYRVFGVRKFDTPKVFGNSSDSSFTDFFTVLDKLASRELTGDAARFAFAQVLGQFTEEDADFVVRVLDKDLKAGFSADTFNKVHPTNKIPTFEVMLADKCESTEDFEKEITFPCQGDFKYDGCLSKYWEIQLKDGRTVTIGEFVDQNMEGEVLSYNVTTKKNEWKKIVARIKNSMPEKTYEWFRLTLEDGTVLPPLTGNHRVWLPTLKCWRRVDELQIEDILLSNKNHYTLSIVKIEKLDMVEDRYDIQVEGNENFFADNILVHNCRTIAIVKSGEVQYYSRSGKIAFELEGLFDEELMKIHTELGYDFILDGERYASNFTETMNAKKSGNNEAKKNLRFRAFFLMPLTDWIAQSTKITMRTNRAALTELLVKTDCKKIILSEGREVQNYHDMMEFCNEAIDKFSVEGLILKDWNSTYQWDRKIAWCKVKRFYDADCRVVGFYPGRPKSRLENTLGGINVVGFLEDGTRVECNVGSGFSDDLRNEIWNNQEAWLGRTVVIKYQEVSKSKGKDVSSLRFPTFERDRDDKVVEI